MSLRPAQVRVFKEALSRLESKPWFRGVCLDNFPSNASCEHDFSASVESVIAETEFWDAPYGTPGTKETQP